MANPMDSSDLTGIQDKNLTMINTILYIIIICNNHVLIMLLNLTMGEF